MILFFIFHVLFASLIAGVLALCAGALMPWISWISLIAGGAVAYPLAVSFARRNPDWRFARFADGGRGLVELILTAFIMYVGLRHFMWLLFPVDHDWATLSLLNFGDLPMHINYTRFFASGAHFPPLDPIFASESLHYPFGVDFYSALWESIGLPLRSHFFLVGMMSMAATLLFLRTYGGWWAILALFLSGGWTGWSVVSGQPLLNVTEGIEWKNLFLSVFLTQRSVLFALPAGLFLLQAFERHISGRRILSSKELNGLGVLWGFFPWFHLHVFLIVSIMMASLAFVYGRGSGLVAMFRNRLFAVAFVPATFFILRSTDFFQKASVITWKWGWMYDGKENFLSFLNFNFGPWLYLPLAICVALLTKRPKLAPGKRERLIWEFSFALFFFILFFNLILAPWAWDNIKILIWPYLWMVRVAYLLFDDMMDDWIRGGVAAVMGLSGFMVLAWSIQSPLTRSYKIFHFNEVAVVEGSVIRVPVNAVFAASPTHDHPLAFLGRARALGYLGHLWTHGINSTPMEHLQTQLMSGDPDWLKIAHQMGVTHIFWGPWERLRYGDHDRVWMHLAENVSQVKGFEVYRVPQSASASTDTSVRTEESKAKPTVSFLPAVLGKTQSESSNMKIKTNPTPASGQSSEKVSAPSPHSTAKPTSTSTPNSTPGSGNSSGENE